MTPDGDRFLAVVRRVARHVPFAKQALAMWFAARDRRTPTWVKAMIGGALAYFVLPIDVVTDFLPLLGYSDDAGVLFAVYQAVSRHVTADHQLQAQEWLEKHT